MNSSLHSITAPFPREDGNRTPGRPFGRRADSGTLTVVLAPTGIGKTQLGLQFAHYGMAQEGESGILFDLTSRGDSQHHREYARRLCGWELRERSADLAVDPTAVWDKSKAPGRLSACLRADGPAGVDRRFGTG